MSKNELMRRVDALEKRMNKTEKELAALSKRAMVAAPKPKSAPKQESKP